MHTPDLISGNLRPAAADGQFGFGTSCSRVVFVCFGEKMCEARKERRIRIQHGSKQLTIGKKVML
jgi:hypothetical protein